MAMRYAHRTPDSKSKAVKLLMKTDQVAGDVAGGILPKTVESDLS